MKVTISKSKAKGKIKAIASKSYAHRIMIASFLTSSSYHLDIDKSNDILATENCLDTLKDGQSIYDANESGSTLRFLIPLILALKNEGTIKGTKKLFSRGLDIYLDIFKKQGVAYELKEDSLYFKGILHPDVFIFRGDVSSQYVTGLLFALPLLDGDSEIILTDKIESSNYIYITIDILNKFNIKIDRVDNHFYIKGNQKYLASGSIEVEGDYSNAAFIDAFNLIGGEVEIDNLNPTSLQGDKIYRQYFKELSEGMAEIDLANSIDLGPILFTLAFILHGATFKNFERLKIKESDRLNEMLSLLAKFGMKYELSDKLLTIYHSEIKPVDEIIVPPNDHRVVMSLCVLLSLVGGSFVGGEAVNKSYPRFYEDIKKLGIEVKIDE